MRLEKMVDKSLKNRNKTIISEYREYTRKGAKAELARVTRDHTYEFSSWDESLDDEEISVDEYDDEI